ncbi:MAG: RNA 2',3'-cyclic phosphodiesterase [Candidatus Aquicultorales bacterium]
MRIFFGVDLPDAVKDDLASLAPRSGVDMEGAMWTPSPNLHFTLKFIGNVDEGVVGPMAKAVEEALRDVPVFTFTLGSAGAFPSPGRARVVWYGVKDGTEPLEEVARRIDRAVKFFGIEPETRRFHAHATLARLKTPKDVRHAIEALDSKLEGVEIDVTGVALFESVLKKTGAEYTVLRQLPLNG